MSTNINSLSDKILLSVFDHMHLSELLRIDEICNRWKTLQPSACVKRKSITLLVGNKAVDMINSSRFATPRGRHIPPDTIMFGAERLSKRTQLPLIILDEATVRWLCNIFPNVTKLEIVQRKQPPSTADQLIVLLGAWADNLTSLKLDCSYRDEARQLRSERISNQLFCVLNCINSLPKLRYLAFESDNWLHSSNTDTRQVDLPILARLKEFYFFTEDRSSIVLTTLQQHGRSNEQLHRIGLGSTMTRKLMAAFCARVDLEFAAKFCQLSFRESLTSLADWQRLSSRFVSLNKLWIPLDSKPPWAQVSHCLAQLRQLVCLRLSINFARSPPVPSGELEPAQLTSVRILGLFINPTDHDDLTKLQLTKSLPNVQIIDIAIQGRPQCTICANGATNFDEEHCIQLLLRSLRQFTRLRKLCMMHPEPRLLSLDQP